MDQLKKYFSDDIRGDGVPLYFHPDAATMGDMERIRIHRVNNQGVMEFLVHWRDSPVSQDTWEVLPTILAYSPNVWSEYFRREELFPDLLKGCGT